MDNQEYLDLLNKGRQISRSYSYCVPLDKEGNRLESIVPDSYLYIACGEDTIVYVDKDMKPLEIAVEPSKQYK